MDQKDNEIATLGREVSRLERENNRLKSEAEEINRVLTEKSVALAEAAGMDSNQFDTDDCGSDPEYIIEQVTVKLRRDSDIRKHKLDETIAILAQARTQ